MHEPLTTAAREALYAALAMLQQGRLAVAAELHARISADFPEHPELAYLASELAVARGDSEGALEAIQRAVSHAPESLPIRMREADLLATARRRQEAIASAVAARSLAGSDARTLWALGRIHARCGDPVTACELYREARASIDEAALLNDLGVSEFFLGEADSAEATFSRVLELAPEFGPAAYMRSMARRQTPQRNHVDALREASGRGDLGDADRAAYLYALAKELGDLGEHDASFIALSQGARLKRGALAYDAPAERDAIASIGRTFTGEALASIAPGVPGDGVVFVVGMPRTGTTLLERLLAREAGLMSAGELPDFGESLGALANAALADGSGGTLVDAARSIDFAELGRRYLRTARQAVGGAGRFLDKMPINFMYCGLIQRALPGARIVHLTRDPMDTCYAVFKTLFGSAYFFSYDQDELAEYYLTYRDLMHHWHDAMPGSILDVRYEDLVTAPDREVARVMEWCGLDRGADEGDAMPDRASMTASAIQVREPVHTGSIGSWKRHADGLATLRRRLEAAGVALA